MISKYGNENFTVATSGSSTTDASSNIGLKLDTVQKDRLPPINSFRDLLNRIKYYFDEYPVKAGIFVACRGLVSIIAAMLAWECNAFENTIMRIVVTVIAFLLAELYIMYYAIYHTIFGVVCYTSSYTDANSYSSYDASLYEPLN
jgi:hypothetical protein